MLVLSLFCFFTALKGETAWKVTYTLRNVCAVRGSTVNISCTYEYPDNESSSSIVKETLWFTKIDRNQAVNIESEPTYKGRVEYSCGENQCTTSTCSVACTLRIKDLKLSDSAEYKFWPTKAQTAWEYTADPGVNLNVTGKLDNSILLRWPKWELVIIIPLVPFNVCNRLLPYYKLIEF